MSVRLKRSSSEIALGRKRPCPHRQGYTWWPWRPNKRRRRRDAAPSQAAASIKESYDTYQSMGGSEFNARPRLPPAACRMQRLAGWLSSALSMQRPFVEETRARSRPRGWEGPGLGRWEWDPSIHAPEIGIYHGFQQHAPRRTWPLCFSERSGLILAYFIYKE